MKWICTLLGHHRCFVRELRNSIGKELLSFFNFLTSPCCHLFTYNYGFYIDQSGVLLNQLRPCANDSSVTVPERGKILRFQNILSTFVVKNLMVHSPILTENQQKTEDRTLRMFDQFWLAEMFYQMTCQRTTNQSTGNTHIPVYIKNQSDDRNTVENVLIESRYRL